MGLDVADIGMGSAGLSLDLRCFVSKAAAVRQTDKGSPAAAASDVDAYIRRLEEERGKIEVFRRELPLCARLLADVIDVMKEETEMMKKKEKEEASDKSKWMSTAQLWTGGSGSGSGRRDAAAESEKQDNDGRNTSVPKSCGGGGGGGAFVPFKAVGSGAPAFGWPCLRKDDKPADLSSLLSPPPPAIKSAPVVAAEYESRRQQVVGFAQAAARAAAATAPSGPAIVLQPQLQQTTLQQQQQQARKSRRSWSPELHRQFVAALNQLGGPRVATPKQIRELMKVDGLTNDEVKSHLQKYRLHNQHLQTPAVVAQPIVLVGGGLWIPHQAQQSSSSSNSQSGSPHGPLRLSTSDGGVTVTASCEEEEDGGRSGESYGWK